MRNWEKQKEQGMEALKNHRNAHLRSTEIDSLYDSFFKEAEKNGINNAVFELIVTAFYAGVAVGKRNA